MASLGEHFEWVIIDTPPVMAVTDASVIAHSVTGVVFVVGSEMTSKGADNVFAALNLPDADEWLVKAELARAIQRLMSSPRQARSAPPAAKPRRP